LKPGKQRRKETLLTSNAKLREEYNMFVLTRVGYGEIEECSDDKSFMVVNLGWGKLYHRSATTNTSVQYPDDSSNAEETKGRSDSRIEDTKDEITATVVIIPTSGIPYNAELTLSADVNVHMFADSIVKHFCAKEIEAGNLTSKATSIDDLTLSYKGQSIDSEMMESGKLLASIYKDSTAPFLCLVETDPSCLIWKVIGNAVNGIQDDVNAEEYNRHSEHHISELKMKQRSRNTRSTQSAIPELNLNTKELKPVIQSFHRFVIEPITNTETTSPEIKTVIETVMSKTSGPGRSIKIAWMSFLMHYIYDTGLLNQFRSDIDESTFLQSLNYLDECLSRVRSSSVQHVLLYSMIIGYMNRVDYALSNSNREMWNHSKDSIYSMILNERRSLGSVDGNKLIETVFILLNNLAEYFGGHLEDVTRYQDCINMISTLENAATLTNIARVFNSMLDHSAIPIEGDVNDEIRSSQLQKWMANCKLVLENLNSHSDGKTVKGSSDGTRIPGKEFTESDAMIMKYSKSLKNGVIHPAVTSTTAELVDLPRHLI
jgi:hypothetical protein